MRRNKLRSQKGMATIEFTGVALVLMVVAFGIVEFGSLIQAQAVVTNVTREGGSLASRDLKSGTDLFRLMEGSTWPLNFDCPAEEVENGTCNEAAQDKRFKIYIATIEAGVNSENPDPVCTVEDSGKLDDEVDLSGKQVVAPDPNEQCDLPDDLWNLLTFDEALGSSGAVALSQLTLVKVYYHHDSITPLVDLLSFMTHLGGASIYSFDTETVEGDINFQNDSFLISSRAIF